ncbi:MAG: bifunctional oligoribonuclease/PAP phosphatase NrnA [Anaerolineales bacterium]|nr:bifunctional oligoribonuclease/PAP phosphatase NrnA [Anaerolineales bacterium]
MDNKLIGEIKDRLAVANKIVVAAHVRPDGDAIGSVLGLGLALQEAGKTVEMILVDGVPTSFRFLEGSELIKKEASGGHDTFITVDCADFKRLGKIFENFGQPDINIDHHKTNEKFGKINLIEADEVATAAILTNYIPTWGLQITQPVAAALLTGIITDTLGFRTSNTTPEALRQAATLMEAGVNLPEIYMQALVRKTYPAAKYWGAGLFSLESKDGIVWGTLTLADRKSAGYSGNDDADLINMISTIDNHKIGMVFVEQADNHVKISWRALDANVDVSPVAKYFNGGGHAAAAGADIEGSLSKIQKEVLMKTKELLNL